MARDYKSRLLQLTAAVAVAALLSSPFAVRAIAAERREHREEGWREHEVQRWGHGDIWRFHEEDLGRWRGGHWWHGAHVGRLGWWWVVDGAWYFYPAPIYPYPDPYVPPTVVTQAPPPPLTQSSPQYWYYCTSAKAYYPYATDCPEGWVPVVPQPPPPGQ
jgi:hypothetical protein